MAMYMLHLKNFGRSGGSSAVAAAAYRAGERIRDERTGRIHDHRERQGVLHKEIVLPGDYSPRDMDWALDRANLWNSAERAESRKNARVAREYLVALPPELSADQRLGLVQGFSRELADRYRFALDVSIHAPRDFPGSDPRNFHAHLLATTREATPEGLTGKTRLEWSDSNRRRAGLEPAVSELLHVRERWAVATNAALEEAHVDARVDHRSLAAQGIDREPRLFIPHAAYEMERRGYRSFVAERLRADHDARLALRAEREAARDAQRDAVPLKPRSLDEVRRQAIDNWRKIRQDMGPERSPEPGRASSLSGAHEDTSQRAHDGRRDDDLSR